MRVLTIANQPLARFEITTYDEAINSNDIADFLALLNDPGPLKNEVLTHNEIVNVQVQPPMFSPFKVMTLAFSSIQARDRYLKGEVLPARLGDIQHLNHKLKDFFDAKDARDETNRAAGKL